VAVSHAISFDLDLRPIALGRGRLRVVEITVVAKEQFHALAEDFVERESASAFARKLALQRVKVVHFVVLKGYSCMSNHLIPPHGKIE
jgi:hypothetical protein